MIFAMRRRRLNTRKQALLTTPWGADSPVPDGAGLRPGHPIRSNPSASQTGNYAGRRRNRQSAHQRAYHGTDRNRQQQD